MSETKRKPESSAEKEPEINIRSFTPEWQDSTVDCIRETRMAQYNDDYVKAIYTEGIAKNFQRFPYEDFFIAVDPEAQQVVGNVALRFLRDQDDNTRIGQLRRFNVRPAYEGRGIGSQLINRTLDFAKENHYKEIYLTTESDDEHGRARRLYEKFDFTIVKPEEMPEDDLNLILTNPDNLRHIKEGKTLIYKLELEEQSK